MFQFHASGRSFLKSHLKKDLELKIKEIEHSLELSEAQKKAAILKLKLKYRIKVNQSKLYNF
jgi:hypothetical protein